jgi:hypothetical protein
MRGKACIAALLKLPIAAILAVTTAGNPIFIRNLGETLILID